MRKIVVFLLFLLIFQGVYGSQKDGLLVFPIKHGSTPFLEAQSIHSYLEEGLIKAGKFRIINTRDIELLLEAQEMMLSSFFDETTSVQMGKMLPGRFLFLSTVDIVSAGYAVSGRIIDVESGEVLASGADIIPFDDGEEQFSHQKAGEVCRKLGLSLAGKKIVAPEPNGTYSLTVVSDPEEADIYVDGVFKGVTPTVLSGLFKGEYFLEVKKEAFYYSQEITLLRDKTVYAELGQQYGNIAIAARPGIDSVTIDEVHYGKSLFVEGIPAGPREVLLTADGYYWKGVVPVIPGETVQIDVAMERSSSVKVAALDEVLSSFSGPEFEKSFWGSKRFDNIPPGTYVYRAEREYYTPFEQEFDLVPGSFVTIIPAMSLLPEIEEELFALEKELGVINRQIELFDLPDMYKEYDVPNLLEYENGITLISLIPVVNLISLGTTPSPVPMDIFIQTKLVHILQVGIGLFFDIAILAVLISYDKGGAFAAAALLGGVNWGIGFVSGMFWDDWSKNMRQRQIDYENLHQRKHTLQKRFAVLDALRG